MTLPKSRARSTVIAPACTTATLVRARSRSRSAPCSSGQRYPSASGGLPSICSIRARRVSAPISPLRPESHLQDRVVHDAPYPRSRTDGRPHSGFSSSHRVDFICEGLFYRRHLSDANPGLGHQECCGRNNEHWSHVGCPTWDQRTASPAKFGFAAGDREHPGPNVQPPNAWSNGRTHCLLRSLTVIFTRAGPSSSRKPYQRPWR
jgi:hypothetical protein